MSDLGFAHELANYGEYSGAPNDEQTFAYARTILGLMTRNKDPRGKVLIIGGGIANFTDVAATFKGIIQAIKHYAEEIREGNIKIYVRRAGPNYQEGLRMMKVRAREEVVRTLTFFAAVVGGSGWGLTRGVVVGAGAGG